MKLILKHKLYPAVLALIGLGLALWLVNRFEISVQVESGIPSLQPNPEEAIAPSTETSGSSPDGLAGVVPGSSGSAPLPLPAAIPTPIVAPTSPTPQTAGQTALQSGGLRISNQSDYPIRVVLLSQVRSQPTATPKAEAQVAQYGEPIHWDFAPQEGNTQGLLLALPDRDLRLQPGDVLVAFAQDGSRRYWGPYVVGNSDMPLWNQPGKEWRLRVQMQMP